MVLVVIAVVAAAVRIVVVVVIAGLTLSRWPPLYACSDQQIDGCARPAGSNMSVTYPKLSKFLNETGRQILFTCSWPVYTSLSAECGGSFANESCFPIDLIVPTCSTWRVFKDIMDAYV